MIWRRGNSTPNWVVAVLVGSGTIAAILIAVIVAILTPLPPVDVFTPPAPVPTDVPHTLMPDSVAGHAQLGLENDNGTHVMWSNGSYEMEIQIEITKWDNLSLAASYLNQGHKLFANVGDLIGVSRGEQQWFTHDGDALSVFAWRRGIWVFDVRAPDRGLRNQVAEELALGKSFPGDLSMMPEIEMFDFTLGLTMSVAHRGLRL